MYVAALAFRLFVVHAVVLVSVVLLELFEVLLLQRARRVLHVCFYICGFSVIHF